MRKTKGLKKGSRPIFQSTRPVGNGTPNLDRGSGRIGDSRGSKKYRFSVKILKKSNDLEPRGGSGPVGADGGERPGLKKYRFLFKILLKSIDFERRGRSEQVGAGGRERPRRKNIVFYFKILLKSIDSERRGRSGQAAGRGPDGKSIVFS